MTSERISKLYILVAALFAIGALLSVQIPTSVSLVAFAIAVGVLGVPHGAFDLYILVAMSAKKRPLRTCIIGFIYLIVCLLSIAFWLLYPSAAFLLFLVISIWHFAQDWRHSLSPLFRLSIASVVVLGTSVLYATTVKEILLFLLLDQAQTDFVIATMQLALAISLISVISHFAFKKTSNLTVWQLTELLSLLVSAIVLPTLVHFTLYFCLLHSMKHYADIVKYAAGRFRALAFSFVPIAVLAIVAMSYGVYYLSENGAEEAVMQVVFIGLFGLTVSHMIVIHFWHKRQ